MVAKTLPPDEDEEERDGLLLLAVSGLAVGALAGLAGSAFHLALDGAEQIWAPLLAWAHRYPTVGWLVPALIAAAAAFLARWLVGRFAPEASGSGVQHVESVIKGNAGAMPAAVLPVKFVGGVLALGVGMLRCVRRGWKRQTCGGDLQASLYASAKCWRR